MVILEWDNIKYTVQEKSSNYKWWNVFGYRQSARNKIILDSVSGTIKSGQLVAILGPSGAGKTTLIAAISQRIRGNITGDLIYNGTKLQSEEMTKLSIFVPQTEVFMESVTLYEHIYFQSLLKMSRDTSKQQHIDNINRTLNKLNLLQCRDTRINKLSGGERKKLNLACELLTEPTVVFCDEPTTGLDSYNALSVVKTLKQLTEASTDENDDISQTKNDGGVEEADEDSKWIRERDRNSPLKAILCSIHQPTSDIFHEFTHIIIMSSGRILYQGSMRAAEHFFFKLDLICPANYNPAEYYIKLAKMTDGDGANSVTEKIYQKYKKNRSKILFKVNERGHIAEKYSHNRKIVEQNEQKISWIRQFYVLLYRFAVNARRSKCEKIWLIAASLITAVTMALLYTNVQYGTQSSVQDIEGAIIMMSSEIIFTFLYAVLYDFPIELPMIRRELGEKLYSFSAYYIANFLMIIPLILANSALFLLILAIFTNLIPSVLQFLQMVVVLIFAGITSNAYGYLASGISFKYAQEMAGPLDVIFLALGGFYLSLKTFSIFKYISPFYFCNEALSIIFWSDVTDIQCLGNPGYPCMRNGTEVLEKYAYTSPSAFTDIVGFSVWTIVAHFIAFFGIRRQIKKDGYY